MWQQVIVSIAKQEAIRYARRKVTQKSRAKRRRSTTRRRRRR